MLVIFLGPPGSGKGTQAKIISEIMSIPHVSTGDMLRDHISNKTELGKLVEHSLGTGQLVSDEIVNEIVRASLSDPRYKDACILDGYPRTIEQAMFLDSITTDYSVFYFDIDASVLEDRVIHRYACKGCGQIYNSALSVPKVAGICDKCGLSIFSHRNDDNVDGLSVRLDLFAKETKCLVDYYSESTKLNIIKADDPVSDVTDKILLQLKRS